MRVAFYNDSRTGFWVGKNILDDDCLKKDIHKKGNGHSVPANEETKKEETRKAVAAVSSFYSFGQPEIFQRIV
ncbi:hypothetical protein UZ35_10825 [Heyndrickxia coagulans]|nr:hypothetical protein CIW84_02770 [Heyndrickxia coagulans]KGB29525.1 hypothetical protein IE89_10445 [Heyndrickxia coagulans]KXT20181.1 hypothetical protein UZ35_10825 [Heyndrickxia coagulans]OZV93438.1 hypothetical protein CAY57_14635 [Heyndrickxia coagulans]RCS33460.1 hypothetical protein DN050_09660 [Heyndrickxia coagulans]